MLNYFIIAAEKVFMAEHQILPLTECTVSCILRAFSRSQSISISLSFKYFGICPNFAIYYFQNEQLPRGPLICLF